MWKNNKKEKEIFEIMKNKDFEKLTDTQKGKIMTELHNRWSYPKSKIVKLMNSFSEKSPDILKIILES